MDWTELYSGYSLRVYRYFRWRGLAVHTAEDLTGAVFERAMRYPYDPAKGNLDAWVFAIARNLLRDHLRRQAVRKFVGLDAAQGVASEELPPEQAAIEAERFEQLRRAIAKLKPREQQIVSLRYAAGLRNTQIARVMGLSEKNVGVILSRALKKLRDEIGEDES